MDATETDTVDVADKATDAADAGKVEEADVDRCQRGECQQDCSWQLLLDGSIAIIQYSLTKYSAIIAEVKGYFGINVHVPADGQAVFDG